MEAAKTTTYSYNEIKKEFPKAGSFGEALQSLEEVYWQRGEVICQVWLNGSKVDEKAELDFATKPLNVVKELTFSYQNLALLQRSSRDEIKSSIKKIRGLAIHASADIRDKSWAVAQEKLIVIFDSCYWIFKSMDLLKDLLKDNEKNDWNQLQVQFKSTLDQILYALETQDSALVGDLIEYELLTVLDYWLEILSN